MWTTLLKGSARPDSDVDLLVEFDASALPPHSGSPPPTPQRLIKLSRARKNALDFHIAFCLGSVHRENAAAQRPARYIVVSKDGGFDALFEYARTEGCLVTKAPTILDALTMAALPQPPASPSSTRSEKATAQPASTPKPAAQKARSAATAKKAAKAAMPKRTIPNADDAEKVAAFLRAQSTNRPAKRATLKHHVIHILGSEVKYLPQWLTAADEALSNRTSNLQFQLGIDFPYASCPAVRSPKIVDAVIQTRLACRAILAPPARSSRRRVGVGEQDA